MIETLKICHGPFGRALLTADSKSCIEHVHPQLHLLIKVGGDDTYHAVGGHRVRLSDNTVTLINAMQPHSSGADPAQRTTVLVLTITQEWFRNAILQFYPYRSHVRFSVPSMTLWKEVRHHIDGIIENMYGFGRPQNWKMEHNLKSFCSLLLESGHIELTSTVTPPVSVNNLDRRVRTALNEIDGHTAHGWSVGELASAAGMSRSRLFVLFRDAMGLSPVQYREYRRTETAVRLLTTTDDSLGRLAQQMGFSAQSHFSRFVKQNLGIPPMQLRRYSYCGTDACTADPRRTG